MSDLRAACFGRDVERDGWPSVSVIVPVRNEADHLERAVSSILAQAYPEPFDICLAVAPSDDDTVDVALQLATNDPQVSMVDNPAGVTPAGLNAAISGTRGSIIVRVDGHAELPAGYIRQAVVTMMQTGAVNVGGMQVPLPESSFERAVAAATTSRLGTGGASYRVGGTAGAVDTVYLGVFDRVAGDAIGWFDAGLIRNQDYELNIRLRRAGGTVWFDPALNVGYRPRRTWTSLAKQYFEYGYWKAEVLRRHPRSLRARQAIPPVAVGTVAACAVIGLRRPAAMLIPIGYAAALIGELRRAPSTPSAVVAAATVHVAWSAGIVYGFARPRRSDSA